MQTTSSGRRWSGLRAACYPFGRYGGLFLVLLAVKLVCRIVFASGDEVALFKFVTYWFQSGLHNPWDYVLVADPTFANHPPGAFLYPPLMLFFLAVPRAITYALGLRGIQYTPWAGLPLNLGIVALDVACGTLLVKIGESIGFSRKSQAYVFFAWHLSAVAIYTNYLQTQMDVIPVFFTLLFLHLALRRRYGWANLALAVACLTKTYPLVLVVPYAAMLLNDGRLTPLRRLATLVQFLALLAAGAVATFAPFWSSPKFAADVLHNPEAQPIWNLTFQVEPGFVPIYVTILWFTGATIAAFSLNCRDPGRYAIVAYGLLLPFSSILAPQPMWFLWSQPFLILATTYVRRGWFAYLAVNGAYLLNYSYFKWTAWIQLRAYRRWGWPLAQPLVDMVTDRYGPGIAGRTGGFLYTALFAAQIAILMMSLCAKRECLWGDE